MFLGSAKDLLSFLNELIKFDKENEVGIQTTIKQHFVSKEKLMGFKQLNIHEETGNGYWIPMPNRLEKIKESLIKWCAKNNISIE